MAHLVTKIILQPLIPLCLTQEDNLLLSSKRNVHYVQKHCIWVPGTVLLTDHPNMTLVVDHRHKTINQRTNGPVNAHLRSAAYTNKTCLNIMVFNPSAGADEALGPFSFFRIINIMSICQLPAGFSLQMTF